MGMENEFIRALVWAGIGIIVGIVVRFMPRWGWFAWSLTTIPGIGIWACFAFQ